MCISSRVTKPELRGWHNEIEGKLSIRGMQHISYNVDGAQTERSLTHDIHKEAATSGMMKSWQFPHPTGQGYLIIEAPLLPNGQPRVMSTDGKHAKKNGRNAILSGARCLVLGNQIVHCGQLVDIVEDSESPLLKADVMGPGVDPQDDRAAARLASSAVLQHLKQRQPESIGLIVYLYIIGEIVDAQQSRDMSFEERITSLCRGRFFLEGWRTYINNHPSYSVHTHFISHELYDIFSIFINSMLALILIHRDYYPNMPLMLWAHSTEANEHFYGCARQLLSDFYFVQFLQMIWKILSYMTSQTTREKINSAAAGAAKSGYHHFYADIRGLNVPTLLRFPSNNKFQQAIRLGYAEANALLEILGMGKSLPSDQQLSNLIADPPIPQTSEDYVPASSASETTTQDQSLAAQLSGLLATELSDDILDCGNKVEEGLVHVGVTATSMFLAETGMMYVILFYST
jgi:hypothetical protein